MLRASELHTTAAITPPRPCAACVWHLGVCSRKNGRRWGNYGGGVSVGFFGYLVFLLHPEVLSCLLVFVRLMMCVRSLAGALWRYPGY